MALIFLSSLHFVHNSSVSRNKYLDLGTNSFPRLDDTWLSGLGANHLDLIFVAPLCEKVIFCLTNTTVYHICNHKIHSEHALS